MAYKNRRLGNPLRHLVAPHPPKIPPPVLCHSGTSRRFVAFSQRTPKSCWMRWKRPRILGILRQKTSPNRWKFQQTLRGTYPGNPQTTCLLIWKSSFIFVFGSTWRYVAGVCWNFLRQKGRHSNQWVSFNSKITNPTGKLQGCFSE